MHTKVATCKLNCVEIKEKDEESLVEIFKDMTICESVGKG